MLKKIAMGIVLAGISGGLIYGAAYRTALRAETGAGGGNYAAGSRGNAQGRELQEFQADDRLTGSGRGNGQGRQGSGSSRADSAGVGLAQVQEIEVIEGTVSLVDADQLIVMDADGSQTSVENRAWWYASEAGFSANSGDEIRLTGFYDEGVFETITLENLTQGISVQLREESGRPLWAGGGRNSGS
ncbi:MAG: hypothetical protein PWQ55_1608 [Chloroflexota bacterium]|nr:hypothetical protein [Chloroflexota bacterium]